MAGDIPSGIQGLFLALSSKIIHTKIWETKWESGDQTQIVHIQGKCPTQCILTLDVVIS